LTDSPPAKFRADGERGDDLLKATCEEFRIRIRRIFVLYYKVVGAADHDREFVVVLEQTEKKNNVRSTTR